MKAKALVSHSEREFSLDDVVLPDPGPKDLVVRTLSSGVSVGTEFACIKGKLDWGPHPMVTGYQAVGIVEEIGADTDGFSVGDRVFWRLNLDIRGPDGTKLSSALGNHCSHAVLPFDLGDGIGHVPDGVSHDAASMFVMPAVGLFGTDMADPRLGEMAVVIGCGPIGLGVVAACAQRGCRVIASDLQPRRLAMAEALGAKRVVKADEEDLQEVVKSFCPDGADVVFESTGLPAMIDRSIGLCRLRGKLVWQGNYGNAPLSFHFLPPHEKRLTMFFPSDDGQMPCRMAVLHGMASGSLAWEKTITHRVAAEDAPALYARISAGEADDLVGAVVRWSES
jgi:2-desacetyl-2-hydroxyethyl bacteriochlorophyllide A dehydrogenase